MKVEKVGPRHRRTVTQGMSHLIQDINKSGEIRKRETNEDKLLVTPEYVLSHQYGLTRNYTVESPT